MYDLISKQVSVRKDVIYDESKSWDWSIGSKRKQPRILIEETTMNKEITTATPIVRRSTRLTQAPSHLNDFELFS